MEFRTEDLAEHGAVLVGPGAPDYEALRNDIRRRIANPVAGSPPGLPNAPTKVEDDTVAAVLINRAATGIAAIYQIWSFEEEGGRTYTSRIGGGSNSSVLLPFGLDDRMLKLYGYWHVILPGSKRLVTIDGAIAGDNSDVRPPGPDEVWKGGMIGMFGGRRSHGPLARVSLTLDGVFFADGGFAGPNRGGMWDETVSAAEASLEAAQMARRLHDGGAPNPRVLDEIRAALGGRDEDTLPPPPPPRAARSAGDFRDYARKIVWSRIASMRRNSEDRAVYMLLDWLNAPVPKFRRL